MFGCANAVLIYGWIENNSDLMLDPEWLETNYPFIDYYASETVRNHMYSACYGITCKLDTDGNIIIDNENKEAVQQLYTLWCKYQEKKKKKNKLANKLPVLGFHLVISGDFEWQHKYYTITN
jgi:hypothetical protein